MEATRAIHRIIEQHAAVRGDAPALLGDGRMLSYRDLNQRANAVARCLLAHGFRRGATALINMPRSFDLAVICLGVLKAGGAYAWLDCDPSWPRGISIPQRDDAGDELKVLAIDVTGIDEEYERLTKAGVRFNRAPPELRGGKIRAIYGKDPDGNVIEMQEVFSPEVG